MVAVQRVATSLLVWLNPPEHMSFMASMRWMYVYIYIYRCMEFNHPSRASAASYRLPFAPFIHKMDSLSTAVPDSPFVPTESQGTDTTHELRRLHADELPSLAHQREPPVCIFF